ncbi:unnamed protein product [Rotaria sp. Silwood1]|nr:unnamed protein product [Rotaria sp. Silwood1]CAF1212780.1 unnamed protein product [Rotaria sp. Silwood1]CAF1235879.1 unnamed protein product [Rotaria sp. Silwood1]CAF3465237.1 unnamed protein product [Rotaria sp. Silwood1]CAF3480307.1 unnamed protein product [Rotaria sp. Silwood1]
MTDHKIKDGLSINLCRCRLHNYGCTDLFPSNQLSKHYLSDTHIKSIIKFICVQQNNHEYALIDLVIDPIGTGQLLSSRNNQSNNYSQLVERLNFAVNEFLQSSNTTDIASNTLRNINQISNTIQYQARNLIINMDRNSNYTSNLQTHQDLCQSNEMVMNQIFNLIDSSSDSNELNHHTEQTEQHQNSSHINEHNTLQFHINSCQILQTQLENTSVSTDGTLIWYVVEILQKIDDAISGKQPFIDSDQFQTSMNGQRLWARIYLNGKSDRKFISFHIHLNFPVYNTFSGYIEFILVDQSTNIPLEHIIKRCPVEMNNVNDCIGFDDFIDKNLLHKKSNPYILNHSVYFIVRIEQTDQQKFIHLPLNVQDALARSSLAH